MISRNATTISYGSLIKSSVVTAIDRFRKQGHDIPPLHVGHLPGDLISRTALHPRPSFRETCFPANDPVLRLTPEISLSYIMPFSRNGMTEMVLFIMN